MRTLVWLLLGPMLTLYAREYYIYNNGQKVVLEPIQKPLTARSTSSALTFKKANGKKVVLTDRLFVKCSSEARMQNLIKKYRLKLIKRYPNSLYLLQASSALKAMESANALLLQEGVDFAHPNMIQQRSRR